MNANRNKWLVAITIVSLIILVAIIVIFKPTQSAKANNQLPLKSPDLFLKNQENSFIGDLLDQEAGISAYYKAPDPINLSDVRDVFTTIELETSDYIIGSVQIPNYPEQYQAHAYVHTSGWLLAYFMQTDPVSKIVKVSDKSLNGTILKSVIETLASSAGAVFTDVSYYDFRYPNATNIMLVAEDSANGNNFTIELPSTLAYYERSWSGLVGYSTGLGWWVLHVNGNNPASQYQQCNNNWNCIQYGYLTTTDLPQGQVNTVDGVLNYGVVAIVYRVP